MDNIFIVVPTLNPNIKILDEFLEKLQKEFKNILIFDDGCREEYDEYFNKLESKSIIVLHHYINLGKGRAIKDSFNYLLNKYDNLKGVVTADSDGQHSVEDIVKCAEEILKHDDSLILGCRNFNAKNVPARNRFGNKTTRSVLKMFVGVSVTDTQTGLRGFPKKVMIKYMDTKGERFEYETNQLIDTIEKDIKIKEIPIQTIYVNGNTESHFNPIKDSLSIYKTFGKYVLASLSSFIVDILLFAVFANLIKGEYSLFLSTIYARIISSLYNYFINAKLVFKKKNRSSLIKYYLLVIIQMIISALGVTYLSKIFKINNIIIKLIVDGIIFITNFVIQREVIFVGDRHEK